MIRYAIKVHTPGYQHKKPHIFALSKGYNSGRPMRSECPNCFVILLDSPEEADKMYFMLDGLWRSQVFRMQLVGSVIPFLHVREFANTINRYWVHIHENEKRVDKLITAYATIEKLQAEIESLSKFLNMYKKVSYIDVLKTENVDF